ncbi:MAG TPA: HAD-IIA family hydrolase [Candidatus Limnocylindrales bacterium]|jgi:HAD superfamily hydrolase (TIGR01450 family)|nr:HAD-IIA family hydrolase [Candidatus Limnocylindrales bacterium]
MLLIADLDGVVYRGPEPVPGVAAVLAERVADGDDVVYATNNSRFYRTEYFERLERMGAPRPERLVTSARATALAVAGDRERWCPNGRAMVFGGAGLVHELRDVGLRPLTPTAAGLRADPSALIVGIDFALSYRRLSAAAEAVRRGATFIATNRDHVFPTPHGLDAGAGTMVTAVAAATEREPDLVVGKPQPGLLIAAAQLAGSPVQDAIVIGDSLRTDIAAANRAGARSVLLLTGVSSAQDAAVAPPDRQPTAIARDAAELRAVLERLTGDRPAADRSA